MAFFAEKSAEVGELCRLAREDMYRIQEHSIEAVDRVAVARNCLQRITSAVDIRRIFGPRYVRGAADELNETLELAVRIIAWLWEWRPNRIENEWPEELEAAAILVKVVTVIVSAGTLKITRLKALARTFYDLKDRAGSLSRGAWIGRDRSQIDKVLVFKVESSALGLSFNADDANLQVSEELYRLQRHRWPRYA